MLCIDAQQFGTGHYYLLMVFDHFDMLFFFFFYFAVFQFSSFRPFSDAFLCGDSRLLLLLLLLFRPLS